MVVEISRRSEQRGAVLVVMIIVYMLAFGVLALVVDVGRLISTIRKAQAAVDAASLAGVNQLEGSSGPDDDDGWQRVKPAVLVSLAGADLSGWNVTAKAAFENRVFEYAHGDRTPHDGPGYDHREGRAGNMTLEVVRGITCYSSTGERRWYELESARHYCLANSVEVRLTLSDIQSYFGKLFGALTLPSSRVVARSVLTTPLTCAADRCVDYGISDSGLITPNPPCPPPT